MAKRRLKKWIAYHPGARSSDPITSHIANDEKDHETQQQRIVRDVGENGPGTEEMILERMGFRQRSDASSEISALVARGKLVNLIDPKTKRKIKLLNRSGKPALVRGLPEHQNDANLIERLVAQMDREEEARRAAKRKPPVSVRAPSRAVDTEHKRACRFGTYEPVYAARNHCAFRTLALECGCGEKSA